MKKQQKIIAGVLGTGVLGSLAALGAYLSTRPLETMNSLLRFTLHLAGAREYTCDLHGVPMHYYCAGRRGIPLLLIHGLGNSAEVWSLLFLLLSKDFLVYAPDLPGFGQTPLAPEGVNVRTHVLYLKRFLDALGYPRAILVGNSLGGWIATQFAASYPERVHRLYLLNSAGLRGAQTHSPYAADRVAAWQTMQRIWGYRMPWPAFLLDAVVRTSQQPAYAGFIQGYDPDEELTAVLPQVNVPSVIIWGKRDGLFPLACAYDFHAGIAASTLIILEHIGHMPQIQAAKQIMQIIYQHEKI